MPTKERKSEHIEICLNEDIDINTTGFEHVNFKDVDIVHSALPEVDFDDVDISCQFMGRMFDSPILISCMTGGTELAEKINKNLARAAEACNIPMGVGSQRVALENKNAEKTFRVKEVAPHIFLIGNLGAVSFNNGYSVDDAKRAIEMINANALALHLNPLQEASQPEGDVNWEGCIDNIRNVCESVDKPVIVKEVGEGISREVGMQIERAGAAAIDVAGVGGTSWSLIESYRSKSDLGKKFRGWGVPTAISLVEVMESVDIPVIASGGMRNGVDAAKAIALGTDLVGFALPFLKCATISSDDVVKKIQEIEREIKTAVFLSGSKTLNQMKKKPVVITGKTKEWLELRGIDVAKYARR